MCKTVIKQNCLHDKILKKKYENINVIMHYFNETNVHYNKSWINLKAYN